MKKDRVTEVLSDVATLINQVYEAEDPERANMIVSRFILTLAALNRSLFIEHQGQKIKDNKISKLQYIQSLLPPE